MPSLPPNPARTLRRPILTAQQHSKLNRFWRRQKADSAAAMQSLMQATLSQVMKADGTLKNVASRLGGDLGGFMAGALVIGLRGHPIEDSTPHEGDTVVYNEAAGHFQFSVGPAGGSGAWEPVVSGVDDEAPEFVFEDGDIVVEFVRDP